MVGRRDKSQETLNYTQKNSQTQCNQIREIFIMNKHNVRQYN